MCVHERSSAARLIHMKGNLFAAAMSFNRIGNAKSGELQND